MEEARGAGLPAVGDGLPSTVRRSGETPARAGDAVAVDRGDSAEQCRRVAARALELADVGEELRRRRRAQLERDRRIPRGNELEIRGNRDA
mgnify:CR=1 FL=1